MYSCRPIPSESRKSERLVAELVAVNGKTHRANAIRIRDRSRLPLVWKDGIPVSDRSAQGKLADERGILVLLDRSSPYIQQFEHMKGKCYPFYKLTPYNNCNYWCEYCYLYLTFYMRPQSIHFVNYDKLFAEMEQFDNKAIHPKFKLLNLGELADPIAVDDITGFGRMLVEFNGRLRNSRLMFLTKSDAVTDLLNSNHKGKVILSWSVNSDYIADLFEHRVPSVERRIQAAKKAQDAGYEVRFRIDPIFKHRNWKSGYDELVNSIFDNVAPSMITLGEYRPSKGLVAQVARRFPESKLIDLDRQLRCDAGKKRYDPETRVQLYSHIIEAIRRRDKRVIISLCKETTTVWRRCGLNHRGMCCNCTNIV